MVGSCYLIQSEYPDYHLIFRIWDLKNQSIIGFIETQIGSGNELALVLTRGPEVKVANKIKPSANPSFSRGNQLALQDLNNPPLLIVCPEAENLEFRPGQFLCAVAGLRQRLAELLA